MGTAASLAVVGATALVGHAFGPTAGNGLWLGVLGLGYWASAGSPMFGQALMQSGLMGGLVAAGAHVRGLAQAVSEACHVEPPRPLGTVAGPSRAPALRYLGPMPSPES